MLGVNVDIDVGQLLFPVEGKREEWRLKGTWKKAGGCFEQRRCRLQITMDYCC